jgi:hypothetical protein
MAICLKCKAQTANLGNSFMTTAVIDQNTELRGNQSVMTTTYGKGVSHCILCDKCIGEYIAKLKRSKVNLFAPIFLLVISAMVGGLMIGAGQSAIIKILGLTLIAVAWYFGIKDVMKTRKDANLRAERLKKFDDDDVFLIRTMEREAEREYLKQTNATVSD